MRHIYTFFLKNALNILSFLALITTLIEFEFSFNSNIQFSLSKIQMRISIIQ